MNTPVKTVKLTDLKIPPPVEAAASVMASGDTSMSPQPKPVDVRTAQRWNAECLYRFRQASERQLVARGRFNLALRDWENATKQSISADQLIRSHINAETQLRHDVKAGLAPPRKSPDRPGPSAIDQFAYYTKTTGRRPGGGGSFRRGGRDKNAEVRRQAEAAFRAKQSTGA
jgi:hypothetical protein